MLLTLHVRSVVTSAFCVLDRYTLESFGRLWSMRGEGACGISTCQGVHSVKIEKTYFFHFVFGCGRHDSRRWCHPSSSLVLCGSSIWLGSVSRDVF
jgi:hypothetical protein